MPKSGQQLEALQQDLACPNCEYNLRGLTGEIVNCPECGHQCDIPYLLTRKWTGPWYKVPGLTRVTIPGFIFMACMFFTLCQLVYLLENYKPMYYLIPGSLIFILVWATSMYFIWLYFKNWYGILASLLMHFVLPAYFFGVFGCAIAFLTFFIGLIDKDMWQWIGSLISIPLLLTLLYIANRCQRWIAKQCIRHYTQQYHYTVD